MSYKLYDLSDIVALSDKYPCNNSKTFYLIGSGLVVVAIALVLYKKNNHRNKE